MPSNGPFNILLVTILDAVMIILKRSLVITNCLIGIKMVVLVCQRAIRIAIRKLFPSSFKPHT